jgi:hypothetical protein
MRAGKRSEEERRHGKACPKRLGAKAKKKKVTPGDMFISKATGKLHRVTRSPEEVNGSKHAAFGDLLGTISAGPFVTTPGLVPHHALTQHGRDDVDIMEHDHLHARPSAIVTTTDCLSRSVGLRIALEPDLCEEDLPLAKLLKDPQLIYQDNSPDDATNSLVNIIGNLPMFVNELSWVAQVVHDFGNALELSLSPTVSSQAEESNMPMTVRRGTSAMGTLGKLRTWNLYAGGLLLHA